MPAFQVWSDDLRVKKKWSNINSLNQRTDQVKVWVSIDDLVLGKVPGVFWRDLMTTLSNGTKAIKSLLPEGVLRIEAGQTLLPYL